MTYQPIESYGMIGDMHTVAQQSQGRQLHFETCGQLLFGLNPENQF